MTSIKIDRQFCGRSKNNRLDKSILSFYRSYDSFNFTFTVALASQNIIKIVR